MKRILLPLSILCAVPLLLQSQIRSYEVTKSFSSGTDARFDLAWDGEHLWLSHGEGELSAFDPSNGERTARYKSGSGELRGLTFDGEDLWAAESSGELLRIDPGTGRELERSPSPEKVRSGMSRPSGLAWDGEALWNNDTRKVYCGKADEDLTYRFEPGQEGRTAFDGLHDCPFGLTYGAGYLWVGENGHHRIYMVDPEGYELIDSLDAPGKFVNGLAYADGELWVATNGDEDKDIHRLSLKLEEKEEEKAVRASELELRPNPATHRTEIRVEGVPETEQLQLELYDTEGRLLESRSFQGPVEQLNLRAAPEGSYILRIRDRKGRTVRSAPLLIER